MSIAITNPATGELVKTYDAMDAATVDAAIDAAHRAHLGWRRADFAERARPMRRAAELLRDEAERHARLMAEEMGKPLRDGLAEIRKCAACCEFYADNAERFLSPEPIATEARKSYVAYAPLGVVLAVMPWNFPFWQVFRFAVPGLMAGNGAVLKHASNVPGSALAIEDLLRRAGFPENLFRTLLIESRQVDAAVGHPLVRAVTLTGSGAAGRAVAARAGASLKRTVLELGGSDAYLVLADADLDHAAAVCAKGRLVNSGQSCVAAKRFVVVESVRREFEARFVARMKAAKVGDPLDPETEVGPMARHDLRQELHDQVERSVARGARRLLGGAIPDGPGAFYPPTVLTGVGPGMPAYDEELFGPVAAVIPAGDEEEAIAIANDSVFGLGACVLSRDLARAERIAAERLEVGMGFVNQFVHSDPRLPFGGIRESGYGRELSAFGIREFVNVKTVYVAAS